LLARLCVRQRSSYLIFSTASSVPEETPAIADIGGAC